MRVSTTLFIIGFVAAPAFAQFDYGVSAGGVFERLYARDDGDPHTSTEVKSAADLTYSAAFYYREQSISRVNLGFDLSLVHRSFQVDYGDGGLGGGFRSSARVDMDQLYFGVKPELNLDHKRAAVLRMGIMAGIRVGGSARGSYSLYGGIGNITEGDTDLTSDFAGDFRFAFGLGFRVPVGDQWAITIDPEATLAFSSMLKKGAGMRGSDFGLRIGLSRRSNSKSLSALFKSDRVERNAGSIW